MLTSPKHWNALLAQIEARGTLALARHGLSFFLRVVLEMLSIDHVAAGLLIPQLAGRRLTREVVGVSLIASMVPDVPVVVSGWIGSIDYLSHRGASHSFLLLPLLALVPAGLAILFAKNRSRATFGRLYILSMIIYGVHIVMDLITPFGTQVLYPLSRYPWSLDLFHSFDPFFMVISVIVIVLSAAAGRNRKALARRSLATIFSLYFGYLGFTVVQKTRLSIAFEEKMESEGFACEYVTTVPRTFWRWKGIASADSGYLVAVDRRGSVVLKEYRDECAVPPSLAGRSEVMKFLGYARFPVVECSTTSLEIHNLVYSPDSYRLVIDLQQHHGAPGFHLTGFDLKERNF